MSNLYIIDDLFLNFFPEGLEDEEFINLSKKHKVNNKIFKTIEDIDIEDFLEEYPPTVKKNIQLITKLVTSCSMVSVFEKMAFKNYIADKRLHETFLQSLYELLNNCNEDTFMEFARVLGLRKHEKNCNIAKWPIITFFLMFFNPDQEVFIKPTTIKKVAKLLEYDIKYEATLNYQTYSLVRDMVTDYKKSSSLCKNENNINVQAIMYCALNI